MAIALPPVPTTKDELLISSLRHANEVSGLLNDISAELGKMLGDAADDAAYNPIHEMLRRRFTDCSALHLFIAANNIRVDLPDDLKGRPDEDAGDDS